MILKDLLTPQFEDWILEIYDEQGNLLISTYELNKEDSKWKDFVKLRGKNKILKVEPTEVSEFMNVIIKK